MTDVDNERAPVDGRIARRQRNIDAVLDVVLEMFGEEQMFPTIEQTAKRSGLSLRSLYRYFADPGELLEAVIARSNDVGEQVAWLPIIGDGPLDERIDALVDARLQPHDAVGPVYRGTVVNAARHRRVCDELTRTRTRLREQFEAQFAPELRRHKPTHRDAVTASGDLLTQLEHLSGAPQSESISATCRASAARSPTTLRSATRTPAASMDFRTSD